MNLIRHIVEPSKLVLSWQAPDGDRARRDVGEIVNAQGGAQFRYLVGTLNFDSARSAGFQGYPAFSLEQREHSSRVLETLLTRLPARSRADFGEFLIHHRLPGGVRISDFALLGYTGAKLPSDSFELVPVFGDDFSDLELVLEVCGFRYQNVDAISLVAGAEIESNVFSMVTAEECDGASRSNKRTH